MDHGQKSSDRPTTLEAARAAGQLEAFFPTAGSGRRGACPTLYEPMPTGDGLLARIRVADRILTPRQLAAIGHLAAQYGNGMLEVTARGNLQVRGLRPQTAAPFAGAVLDLLRIETGLVVDTSPISGLDAREIADPGPLAAAIMDGARPFEDRLGPKVSVVIDGGGQVPLSSLKADIRLAAVDEQHWAVTLGGGRPQIMDRTGAIAAALSLLGALAAIGPESRAIDLFPAPADGHDNQAFDVDSRQPSVWQQPGTSTRLELRQGQTALVALPFGSARSTDLTSLSQAAENAGVPVVRLAPNHVLLFDQATDAFMLQAARLGFITQAGDPRRRISACIGNQGCASGHMAARVIAAQLAETLPDGHTLHVSGCAKGCAHPRRAKVTLVGRPDGIGLVIDGRAGDTPRRILDEARLADALVPQLGAR